MATMTTRTAPARPASIPTRGARPPRADTRYRAPDDLAAFTAIGDMGGEMSALALYLDEVRRFPLLSVEQARIAQLVAALLPTEGVPAQTARKHLRMRVVLARYYGDDRRYYGKLAPIAKDLKLTRERVRQIREEAIRILRQKARTEAGRELLALWTEGE